MNTKPLALLSIAFASALAATTASAGNCTDALTPPEGPRSYTCNLKYSDGSEEVWPLNVEPVGPGQFQIEFVGTTHYCNCLSKGSYNNPKFEEASDFICNDAGSFSEAMVGKATGSGKKITGDYQHEGGTKMAVFECQEAVL